MVGESNALITRGKPYAFVLALLLLLSPMLGWGQCPSYTANYSTSSGSVTGTLGVPNDGVSYVRNGNLTINAGSRLVVSGTLEITGDLTLISNFSDVVVCQTGKLIVRGKVTLNSKTTITVQGQVDPANPSDYIGGLLIVIGSVTAANNGNIDLNNGGNVVIAGGASSANFINSSTGDTYINPMPGGNSSSLQTFDQLVNDPIFQEYAKYSCTTGAAADISLSVSPGYAITTGTSVTITASTAGTYSTYAFYIGNSTTPAQSNASKVFTTSLLQNGDVVKVYGINGTCVSSVTSQVFSVSTPPAKPTTPTGTTPICQGTATSTVQTTATSGASTYSWSIVQQSGAVSPGTITGTGTSATITWNSSFSGVALISVAGVNGSGISGPASDALSITVNPAPVPILSATTTCAGQAPTLGLTSSFDTYSWSVASTNFGIVSGGDTALPVLGTPDNDTLFPVGTFDIVAYPEVSVTVSSGGCSATVTNNSTDKKIAVYRIPRTGAPYHIANNVAK